MSVRRVMGTETEYAVSVRQDPHANPVQSSFDVIAHAGDEETRHIRWDYRQEDPVHDMRGMTMPPRRCTSRHAYRRTATQYHEHLRSQWRAHVRGSCASRILRAGDARSV